MLEHFYQLGLNEWRQPVQLNKIEHRTIILDSYQSYAYTKLQQPGPKNYPKNYIIVVMTQPSKDQNQDLKYVVIMSL